MNPSLKRAVRPGLKYCLTNQAKEVDGVLLCQIKAEKGFEIKLPDGEVKFIAKGSLGGWVYDTNGLSQFDKCWLDSDSYVGRGASVRDDAYIEKSVLSDRTVVCGKSVVRKSRLSGNASIRGGEVFNCTLSGNSIVEETPNVRNTTITAGAIRGRCKVENSVISTMGMVDDDASLIGVVLSDHATIRGKARVYGPLMKSDPIIIEIGGDALLCLPAMYCFSTTVTPTTFVTTYDNLGLGHHGLAFIHLNKSKKQLWLDTMCYEQIAVESYPAGTSALFDAMRRLF